MTTRSRRIGAAAALAALAFGNGAAAQTDAPRAGWSFEVAPYLWLPTVSADLRHSLPPSLGGSANIMADAGDYLSDLNAALLLMATARYERFSVVTDLMYVSADAGGSRVKAVDIVGVGRNPVSSSANASGDSNLQMTLWTLAGGYTVASGAWGQVDALAGFRYLGADVRTDYNLTVTLQGPRGNAGPSFGGAGRLSDREDIWNGIVGLRGRINLGDSRFFIPFHLDLGTGDSNLTWQGVAGIGYRTGWGGVQAGWRYLSYDQGGRALIQDMSLSGGYLAVYLAF